ncbi:MAG TPA: membrane protein insertion efficiency factor YidD [Micromonosporaceae bacterium]|jgi:hypothetical protein
MVDPSTIGGPGRRRRPSTGGGGDDHTWDGCVPDLNGCDVPGCDGCDLPCDFFVWTGLLGAIAMRTPRRAPRRRTSAPARLGLGAIRVYQRTLSPRLPVRCRHVPSCSGYGADAVRRYGLVTGARLTASRIRRCNRTTPYGTVDPVP